MGRYGNCDTCCTEEPPPPPPFLPQQVPGSVRGFGRWCTGCPILCAQTSSGLCLYNDNPPQFGTNLFGFETEYKPTTEVICPPDGGNGIADPKTYWGIDAGGMLCNNHGSVDDVYGERKSHWGMGSGVFVSTDIEFKAWTPFEGTSGGLCTWQNPAQLSDGSGGSGTHGKTFTRYGFGNPANNTTDLPNDTNWAYFSSWWANWDARNNPPGRGSPIRAYMIGALIYRFNLSAITQSNTAAVWNNAQHTSLRGKTSFHATILPHDYAAAQLAWKGTASGTQLSNTEMDQLLTIPPGPGGAAAACGTRDATWMPYFESRRQFVLPEQINNPPPAGISYFPAWDVTDLLRDSYVWGPCLYFTAESTPAFAELTATECVDLKQIQRDCGQPVVEGRCCRGIPSYTRCGFGWRLFSAISSVQFIPRWAGDPLF